MANVCKACSVHHECTDHLKVKALVEDLNWAYDEIESWIRDYCNGDARATSKTRWWHELERRRTALDALKEVDGGK